MHFLCDLTCPPPGGDSRRAHSLGFYHPDGHALVRCLPFAACRFCITWVTFFARLCVFAHSHCCFFFKLVVIYPVFWISLQLFLMQPLGKSFHLETVHPAPLFRVPWRTFSLTGFLHLKNGSPKFYKPLLLPYRTSETLVTFYYL